MNNSFDLSLFNSGTQKESDFLASFIARQEVLQFFLAQLQNIKDGRVAKHHLIIAPRGYGKTSLLRRIKIAVRDDAEYNSRFIPLLFREEQHNVISLDLFWRNCLQSLLEAREDERADSDELNELDKLWLQYGPRSELKREEQDGVPAYAAFSKYCRKLGRRPVLLIDNLDALLAGLDKHDWGLRAVLQEKDGPVLIAAASRYPDSLSDQKAAFFDFFRITTLSPLSDQEVMSCLSELARKRGVRGEPVRHMLEADPGRISALNTMAGGNPRTLGVLYTVLESHMSDDVLVQLSAMLDTFTGWYQARTEELPLQSRAVFDALALNWNPMTAADLGKVTGLDTPSISSHLSRMEKGGYVETVALSKSKKTRNGYQVSERFYNIWYLMRNGPRRTRQAIKFLTIFLRSCFSRTELHAMAKIKLQNGAGRVESMLALAACIGDGKLRMRLLDSVGRCIVQSDPQDEIRVLLDELRKGDEHKKHRMTRQQKQANQMIDQVLLLLKAGQFDQSEALCRQVISLDSTAHVSWFLLGCVLEPQINRFEEAEEAYRKAIELDGTWSAPWTALGRLLIRQDSEKREEARLALLKAIEQDSQDAEPWLWLGVLYEEQKNYLEAEASYREAVGLDAKDFRAWDGLGDILRRKEETAEAARDAYQQALMLEKTEPSIWKKLGGLFHTKLKQFDKAEEAYQKAIELDEKDAATWSLLAGVQMLQGRFEDSVQSSMKAIELNGSLEYPKGMAAFGLLSQKRFKEAEVFFRQAIELSGEDANLWKGLADCLVELDCLEEAEAAYRQSIRFDSNNVGSIIRLGNLLQDFLGQFKEALGIYKQGLEIEPQDGCLLANSAYVCALHLDLPEQARIYAEQASSGLSEAGLHLLHAMIAWSDGEVDAATRGWSELHRAVTCGDDALWSNYVDDLQRVLAYALTHGDGEIVKKWMEEADYLLQYAPLYHAYRAVSDGEDYLLSINPEVRVMAERIYRGLIRMVGFYGRPPSSK